MVCKPRWELQSNLTVRHLNTLTIHSLTILFPQYLYSAVRRFRFRHRKDNFETRIQNLIKFDSIVRDLLTNIHSGQGAVMIYDFFLFHLHVHVSFLCQYLILDLFSSVLKINQICISISGFENQPKFEELSMLSNLIPTFCLIVGQFVSPTFSFATATVGLTRFDCIWLPSTPKKITQLHYVDKKYVFAHGTMG